MSTMATMTMRNANYSPREPFRFTRYVVDNGRLYRGVHTHLSLPVCSSHLRLSLINLINRNHIALSVRFCVCINARALMGAIISSRQRENLFVLYQTLLSRVTSIKRKDLYRRSFNLIICRISLWEIRFLFTFTGKERYTYYEVKLWSNLLCRTFD